MNTSLLIRELKQLNISIRQETEESNVETFKLKLIQNSKGKCKIVSEKEIQLEVGYELKYINKQVVLSQLSTDTLL